MVMPSAPPVIKFTNFSITAANSDSVTVSTQPSYGNTFDLARTRIFNDTGDFILSYRSYLWPCYNVLNFDLYPLTKTITDQLQTFMINHIGELVTLIIENISYIGIIQDPQIERLDEHNDNCSYKVTFIFETQVCK